LETIRKSSIKHVLILLAGYCIGTISWGESFNPTFAIFVPLLWIYFETQFDRNMLIVGYYFASTMAVFYAAMGFYDSSPYKTFISLVLWIGITFLICLPWMFGAIFLKYWKIKNRSLINLVVLLCVLLATMIPPFGYIGVTNPLLSLGWLLPGTGWWAFVLFLICMVFFVVLDKRIFTLSVILIPVLIALPHEEQEHSSYRDIVAVSTEWGKPKTMDDIIDRMFSVMDKIDYSAKHGTKTLIYPEGILGDWKDAYEFTWRTQVESLAIRKNVIVGVGLDEPVGNGSFENSIKFASAAPMNLVRARQSSPALMRMPWEREGFNTDWSRSPFITIRSHQTMIVFCYEEHLFGLMLWSLFEKRPDVIISMVNSWWGKDAQLTRAVQLRHAESVAKLFGIPLIRSENRWQD
jgi:hypothetical protein